MISPAVTAGRMMLGPKCAKVLGFILATKKVAAKPVKVRHIVINDAQMELPL